MVLDGPVDADALHQRPDAAASSRRRRGFERALGRFFQACAADQAACAGFGGERPVGRLRRADRPGQRDAAAGGRLHARPAPGRRRRRHRRGGDPDVRQGSTGRCWRRRSPRPRRGDGSRDPALTDEFFYGRDPDTGAYDPGSDRYFTIGATEQHYPRDVGTYLDAGDDAWGGSRPLLLQQRLLGAQLRALAGPRPRRVRRPVPGRELVADAARGRDHVRPGDALPRRAAARARPRQRPAADDARRRPHRLRERQPGLHRHRIETYINTLALPAPGTTCTQNIPFAAAAAAEGAEPRGTADRAATCRPHHHPLTQRRARPSRTGERASPPRGRGTRGRRSGRRRRR